MGRDIKKMVIVDHVKPSMKKYAVSWVEIKPWMGEKSDKVLFKLTRMLLCK